MAILIQKHQVLILQQMIIQCLLISLVVSSQILSPQSLAVTIYNNDFAIVKDIRSIQFDKGESMLYFTDVSENMQPETVTFKALNSSQSIRVYEQNFEKNLIDQNAILKKYIEKAVNVVADFGNDSKRISGILLAYSPNIILKTDKGIVIANKISAIDLASIPDGFFTMPTLDWKVYSQEAQTQKCEVAYRTTGFSWKADYIITINQQETFSDLGGWVTIDNQSGKKYVDAKLKLIAGDVNTVRQANMTIQTNIAYAMAAPVAKAAPPSFSQKSFADYHLYTLSKPVTLNESSQKQIQFIPKVYNIVIRKFNQININAGGYSQQNIPASSKIMFNNTASLGLGMPLPKGTVRVFKQDNADKSLQFIGEDSINHTPKDENVTLTIGNAFDITANLLAINRQTFSGGGYRADMNLTIVNHKQTPSQIQVKFNTYYGNNLSLTWNQSNSVGPLKISANEYKLIQVLKSNEKVSYLWTQNYQN